MTEAEWWRQIAEWVGGKRPPHGFWGLCDFVNIEVDDKRTSLKMNERLVENFLPDNEYNPHWPFWWSPGDKGSRIFACGLLAAMAEEETNQ